METAPVACSYAECNKEMDSINVKCPICSTPYCCVNCFEQDTDFHRLQCREKDPSFEKQFYRILDDLNRNEGFNFMLSFFAHELKGHLCIKVHPTRKEDFQSPYEAFICCSHRRIIYQSDEKTKWTVPVEIRGNRDRVIDTGFFKVDKERGKECYEIYKHETTNRQLPLCFDITPHPV